MGPQSWCNRTLVGVAVVASGLLVVAAAADVLSELGVTEARAKEGIFKAVTSGGVPISGNVKVFKAATPEKRALLVTAGAALAKTYARSDDFKRRYAEFREANKPAAPGARQTADQQIASQRQALEAGVAQMRDQMKLLPPEAQKEIQKTIDDLKAQLAEMEKDPQTKAMLEQGLKGQHQKDVETYQKRLRQFEQDYPKDLNALIAARLREFLKLTKDIDFNAKLVQRDGKMRFADPALEEKPAEWKMGFRAGKPAVDAARAFATDWLKELEGRR